MLRRILLVVVCGLLASGGTSHAQTSFSFSIGNGWPAYGSWSAPYPYQYPYWYGDPYWQGPIVLNPLFIPAETMYGPLAMQRFMGMNNGPIAQPPVIIANQGNAHNVARPVVRPKVRMSNAAMKAQAAKFISFGDANFGKQNYNAAMERYRSAMQSAPDLPEVYLRQGIALIAMGQYESAAKAMRRALLMQGNPAKWPLRLDDLYQEDQIAKTAHIENLARSLEADPQSPDLMLLLALTLYFDGQPERALPVFRRCEQLGGNEDGSITGFLQPVMPKPVDAGKEA